MSIEKRVGQLVDAYGDHSSHDAAAFLAAIVESSDDAIVSKNLDGTITTWNRAAERIFGYSAREAVGRPITMIIPDDRLDEEPAIIARIQAGERVDHFETVRRRKDSVLIDISLTISPIRDNTGRIVGASKIARDISEYKRAAERRDLLLREMHHRVKNVFAITSSVITLTARNAFTVADLASSMKDRLMALARAHEITLPSLGNECTDDTPTTIFELLSSILSPYGEDRERPWALEGDDLSIEPEHITPLALIFHEFATNAAKYGAFAADDGRLTVTVNSLGDHVEVLWSEERDRQISDLSRRSAGFGSVLETRVAQSLGAQIERAWRGSGLTILVWLPLREILRTKYEHIECTSSVPPHHRSVD